MTESGTVFSVKPYTPLCGSCETRRSGTLGGIQLKRVVEMAGMLEYCDFDQQQSVQTEEGQLRPDMAVNLPGGWNVVLDSKVPLTAFLDGTEATDEDIARFVEWYQGFLVADQDRLCDRM